ncbi:MAG: hypothetical protein LBP86_08925, partial [Azoarcus sp.]|jgi:hypothetical protein|nr:hypothetical protein [Azoarcus sp.]
VEIFTDMAGNPASLNGLAGFSGAEAASGMAPQAASGLDFGNTDQLFGVLGRGVVTAGEPCTMTPLATARPVLPRVVRSLGRSFSI